MLPHVYQIMLQQKRRKKHSSAFTTQHDKTLAKKPIALEAYEKANQPDFTVFAAEGNHLACHFFCIGDEFSLSPLVL